MSYVSQQPDESLLQLWSDFRLAKEQARNGRMRLFCNAINRYCISSLSENHTSTIEPDIGSYLVRKKLISQTFHL